MRPRHREAETDGQTDTATQIHRPRDTVRPRHREAEKDGQRQTKTKYRDGDKGGITDKDRQISDYC